MSAAMRLASFGLATSALRTMISGCSHNMMMMMMTISCYRHDWITGCIICSTAALACTSLWACNGTVSLPHLRLVIPDEALKAAVVVAVAAHIDDAMPPVPSTLYQLHPAGFLRSPRGPHGCGALVALVAPMAPLLRQVE